MKNRMERCVVAIALCFGAVAGAQAQTATKALAQQNAVFYGAVMSWIKQNESTFKADWRYPGPVVFTDGGNGCVTQGAYKIVNLLANYLPAGWKDANGVRAHCADLLLDTDGHDKAVMTFYAPAAKNVQSTALSNAQKAGALSSGWYNQSTLDQWYPNALQAKSTVALDGFTHGGAWRFVIFPKSGNMVAHAGEAQGTTLSSTQAAAFSTSGAIAGGLPSLVTSSVSSALDPSAAASSGTTGTPTVSKYNYGATGGITPGTTGTPTVPKYNYGATGGITPGTTGTPTVPKYNYGATGGITLGATGTPTVPTYNYGATGGITLGATGTPPVPKYNYGATGGITPGTTGTPPVPKYNYGATGSVLY